MKELGPDARAVVRAGRTAGLPSAADRERNFEALRSRLGDGSFIDDASQLPLRASRALPTTIAVVSVGVAVVVGALFFGLRHRTEPNRTEPMPVNGSITTSPGLLQSSRNSAMLTWPEYTGAPVVTVSKSFEIP